MKLQIDRIDSNTATLCLEGPNEPITIACANATEVVPQLVRLVNRADAMLVALRTLRSPLLGEKLFALDMRQPGAQETADELEKLVRLVDLILYDFRPKPSGG